MSLIPFNFFKFFLPYQISLMNCNYYHFLLTYVSKLGCESCDSHDFFPLSMYIVGMQIKMGVTQAMVRCRFKAPKQLSYEMEPLIHVRYVGSKTSNV